jgi:hypothetical protein
LLAREINETLFIAAQLLASSMCELIGGRTARQGEVKIDKPIRAGHWRWYNAINPRQAPVIKLGDAGP